MTAHIASSCNGKARCDYVVDYRVIGDPAVGCAKEYAVRYACGSGGERQATAPKEAGFRKTVTLQCDAAHPVATPGVIRIESATYGGNCGARGGNATAHIANSCNGRDDCSYVIDYTVIGDPVVGCGKDYRVSYSCGAGRRRSASASPEAGFRKRVDLSCR